MKRIFLPDSPYKTVAMVLAIGWTVLIFILFMMPGSGMPKVRIPLPFADKWIHAGFFAVFCFLWMAANPCRDRGYARLLWVTSLCFGWVVEFLQGYLSYGRSHDYMDLLADGVGSLMGIGLFRGVAAWVEKRSASPSLDRP